MNSSDKIMAHPTSRYRVAFVNSHPIQYFAPLYRYLQQEAGLDVTAIYLSDVSVRGEIDQGFGRKVAWDVDLLGGYTSVFVGEAARRRRPAGFFSLIAPQIWGLIRSGSYDAVIIHAHNFASHHIALAACRSIGTIVLARSDTNANQRRSWLKAQLRSQILTLLYKCFDGALAIGAANRRHYLSMGVSPENIFLVPFAVDNAHFAKLSNVSATKKMQLRRAHGFSEHLPAILFVAKLEKIKRPGDVVEAFSRLRNEGTRAQLIIVGTGPLESELKRLVSHRKIENIIFLGFVNQAALPEIYAASDVFVLPSEREAWGLVVNEAMCAALPIVVSNEVGCHEDLVTPGGNGDVFPAGDISRLVEALRPIVTEEKLRAQYGDASRNKILEWSYSQCASGLKEAIETLKSRQIAR